METIYMRKEELLQCLEENREELEENIFKIGMYTHMELGFI